MKHLPPSFGFGSLNFTASAARAITDGPSALFFQESRSFAEKSLHSGSSRICPRASARAFQVGNPMYRPPPSWAGRLGLPRPTIFDNNFSRSGSTAVKSRALLSPPAALCA